MRKDRSTKKSKASAADIYSGKVSVPPGPDVPDPVRSAELGINPNDAKAPRQPKCSACGFVLRGDAGHMCNGHFLVPWESADSISFSC
jgi:hypothetical protein